VTFLIIAPYTYNLTGQFLVDNYLWPFYGIGPPNHVEGKFLLQGLECHKDTQIKAYAITELTAEQKSDKNNLRH